MSVLHMNSDQPGGKPTMCGRGRSGTWDAPAVTCKVCLARLEAVIVRTHGAPPQPRQRDAYDIAVEAVEAAQHAVWRDAPVDVAELLAAALALQDEIVSLRAQLDERSDGPTT